MNGHQIDELLKRKVDDARRGRILRIVAALAVLLALIVLIAAAVHRHNAKAVSKPDDPSTVETETEAEPSPDEPETNAQGKDGQKPLQPEEMRRSQIKHEFELEWKGVPEEEMPSAVTVTVLHQGEEVSRFTLTEENEWRHSWSDAFEGDVLTLRADLPKSVMGSFVLQGNKFTMTGSYAVAPAQIPADPAEGEAPAADEGEQAEDGQEESADQPQTVKPAAPAQSDEDAEEADAEDGEATDEISETPAAGRRWWPIVLLMVCGAALVTLGMLGTDRRRSR